MIRTALVLVGAVLAGCSGGPPSPAVPPTEASATPAASASASASSKAPRTIQVRDGDAGKTIDAKAGDTVALTLEANPSTGYDWQVDKVDKTLGQPKLTRPTGPAPENKVGAPSTVTFTWVLSGPLELAGDHAVELAYRRPWEKDDPPEKTFRFTIKVTR